MRAVELAQHRPGETVAILGAGPIGLLSLRVARAAGASQVIISDLMAEKLEIAGSYSNILPVDIRQERLTEVVARVTDGWGADIVFEASGSPRVFEELFTLARPGGAVVLVGMPVEPVALDIVGAQARELRIETVFRYTNVFDRALALIASGAVDLKRLITGVYSFEDAVAAFERAAEGRPSDVKLQIELIR